MPLQSAQPSIHDEIHQRTSTENSAHPFLQSREILKTSMTCSFSTPMILISRSEYKSADLYIWKCPSCKKFKNIRTDNVLAGCKLSFKSFLALVFCFSIRALSNVEIAALIGLGWNHVHLCVHLYRTVFTCVVDLFPGCRMGSSEFIFSGHFLDCLWCVSMVLLHLHSVPVK